MQSDGVQSEYGNAEAAEPTGLPHLRRGRGGIGASSDFVCLTARVLDTRRPAGEANPLGDVDNPRAGDIVVEPRAGGEIEEEEAVRPARAVMVTPQHEMKKNFIVVTQLRRARRNCDPYGVKKRGTRALGIELILCFNHGLAVPSLMVQGFWLQPEDGLGGVDFVLVLLGELRRGFYNVKGDIGISLDKN